MIFAVSGPYCRGLTRSAVVLPDQGLCLTDKSCSRFLVCEMAVDWTILAKHEWMGLVKGQAAPQWLQTRGISMKRPRAGRGTVYGI